MLPNDLLGKIFILSLICVVGLYCMHILTCMYDIVYTKYCSYRDVYMYTI